MDQLTATEYRVGSRTAPGGHISYGLTNRPYLTLPSAVNMATVLRHDVPRVWAEVWIERLTDAGDWERIDA